MKKFLLSLAALAMAAGVSATSYTIFDISNPGSWSGDASGWTNTVTVGGKTFTLSTAKESTSATDLISPVDNQYAWRVYKGTSVTIDSPDLAMKQVLVTFDSYESNGTTYYGEMVLSSGWTGTLDGVEYTLVSAGLNTIKMTAEVKQVRITTIVVSDEQGDIDPPVTPDLPDDVVYQNNFDSNLDGWTKINDEALGDFSGWKINTGSVKCAICNSYYEGTNHAANAKMQLPLDLTDRENCSLSFSQAFGYDFPQAQCDNYRLYVINETENTPLTYLTIANYPAVPDKNWSDWAANEFDMSEYDGCKIIVGFEYATDGSKSRAWELKDFVFKGDKLGAVENIGIDSNAAPVYYNLQGVRVNNPVKGLFIEVKGGKSQKVIF